MLLSKVFIATLALFLGQAAASAYDFPSFDIFHSHCGLNVKYANSLCVDVYQKITSTLDFFNAGHDPAKGTY